MTKPKANYQTILAYGSTPHRAFKIMYDPDEEWPWVVAHLGSGSYFYTPRECLAYCYGRGFIKHPNIETLAAEIAAHLEEQERIAKEVSETE